MELTKERRIQTGAFYTPKIWADKAVEYIREILPNMEDYFFWDMCAGEGALLEALPENCDKYGTTLEYEDYQILKSKGFNSNQFDFLDGDISKLQELKGNENRLIVFTNPPYFKLSASHDCYAKRKYKTNDSVALFFYRIVKEVKPLLICSFNKLDLYQGSTLSKFRNDIPIFQMTIAQFLSPSQSWGLKGNFPIAFNILYVGGSEDIVDNA